MLHPILQRAVRGACLCCALISLGVSADTAASETVNKASITVDEYLGPRPESNVGSAVLLPKQTQTDTSQLGFVLHWNSVAIDASGLDHTPVKAGENRIYGEAVGPGRSARAIAIVHIAMFDAMTAVEGGYKPFTSIPRVADPTRVSTRAAIAQAAHDTLKAMFPSQSPIFARELQTSLDRLPADDTRKAGRSVGADAAKRILRARKYDGSYYDEPTIGNGFTPSNKPGWWRADPVSRSQAALGATWGEIKPFVITSGKQFRAPPPPEMTSREYVEAYEEVQRLGGDGVTTPTERTQEQTFIGIFWAYDGMPSLCAPPRLYNQIATTIARQMGSDATETARLLALVNVALADAGIAIWDSKFYYQFWRPVTAIRESDLGTGPTGKGDGNPATVGDPTFSPLGAPASNLKGPNFTPPFPAYPSGHAGFGGALFQTLRRFYGTDDISFTFVSDEYNGVTRDNEGVARIRHPRTFKSLSEAEEENGQSRIYLGIHWAFDKTEGITQGQQIADYVFDRIYRPLP
ncbi:MAG TPA: phosphatase PAP2 family protein [Steroidobacter sp.]|uniref:vanadium-dependent haloperoxidase n=1 Tax=Steroidobacter sp. TaxID=1978227 RepID=UPI002EDA4A6B